MKPESDLPWVLDDAIVTTKGEYVIDVGDCNMSRVDAAYVVHACNAYPKLVEMLQWLVKNRFTPPECKQLLKDLGEWNE